MPPNASATFSAVTVNAHWLHRPTPALPFSKARPVTPCNTLLDASADESPDLIAATPSAASTGI
eukprot:6179584-Pleurochrysis_carterae.AAC.1